MTICEVKPKSAGAWTKLNYMIFGYSLNPIILGLNIGPRIVIHAHLSIENCVIQINLYNKFSEVCFLEI